jgi:hypothetical protein
MSQLIDSVILFGLIARCSLLSQFWWLIDADLQGLLQFRAGDSCRICYDCSANWVIAVVYTYHVCGCLPSRRWGHCGVGDCYVLLLQPMFVDMTAELKCLGRISCSIVWLGGRKLGNLSLLDVIM